MKTSRIQWCPEAQQQAILALGTALDAPSGDTDRAFFTRHPERDYLVRRARKVELRANEIVMGGKLQKPDGFRWYYAVQQRLGRMKRLFSAAPLHHPERFSDAACRMVFEQVGDAAA